MNNASVVNDNARIVLTYEGRENGVLYVKLHNVHVDVT